MLDDLAFTVGSKLREWGLLISAVVASSTALSLGLGWQTIFRRVLFSGTVSLVIASTAFYSIGWSFTLSCAAGYFISFLVESAFRQRLDHMGRAVADKMVHAIDAIPLRTRKDKKDVN